MAAGRASAGPLLIPILGDQLSPGMASLTGVDPADAVLLMMEVADETTYVRHHQAKITLILSAMRHHAATLAAAGWRVDYVRLDDPANSGSFTGEVARVDLATGAKLASLQTGAVKSVAGLVEYQGEGS